MRLDHLLSREKSRCRNAAVPFQVDTLSMTEGQKSSRKDWSKLFVLQSLYRFQGSKPGSTLKTAQPDGKHLVEKPVAILQIGLRITIKL